MENLALIDHPELYSGQYVALKSFSDRIVITFGQAPQDVVNQAKNKGIQNPVIVFVPEKGLLNIY